MDKFNVIVGIDIAKSTMAICMGTQTSKEIFEVTNDSKGLSTLIEKLKDHQQDQQKILLCCENTGRYMDKLALVAQGEGLFLWAVNPFIISQYHGAKLKRGKTDASDAEKIMDFATAHLQYAVKYHSPDQVTRELMMLFKLRKHLVDTKQRHLNFEHSYLQDPLPALYNLSVMQALIQYLGQQIKAVEAAIKQFITKHATIKKMYHLLLTVPGIGPVIAQRFLYVTQCFQKFNSWRELACYIGSAPFEYQSGSSIKRKPSTSKKRCTQFKADLHEGAVSVATREGQFFYEYYQKMIRNNNHSFKAINNIINMILKIVFQIIRTNKPFDKNFYLANKKSWQNLVMS